MKKPKLAFRLFTKDLAATYSRGIYKTTTIGNAVFDGRVRNGIGSDHSFMATKKLLRDQIDRCQFQRADCAAPKLIRPFSENYTQEHWNYNS